MNLQKVSVLATILASFIDAAFGSPFGAVVFWVSLFSAAVVYAPENHEPAEFHLRWM